MESRSFMVLPILLIVSSFCFYFSSAECPADKEKAWSYDVNLPNGPPHWSKKYPSCGGKSQSPVDIKTSDLEPPKKRPKLSVEGYDEPISKAKIYNDGHLIWVEPQDGKERSVTYENEKYMLKHFHFHWGSKHKDGSENVINGSEDVINGHKYTMEVHLVHHNKGKMVVVGGFLQEGNSVNSALQNIFFLKPHFEYEGGQFEGDLPNTGHKEGKIDLKDLIDTGCLFYEYSGSIGFPPCTEGITWLICRSNKGVKSNQLDEMFSIYSVKKGTPNIDKCHLTNIFRPVQPLNGRKVKG